MQKTIPARSENVPPILISALLPDTPNATSTQRRTDARSNIGSRMKRTRTKYNAKQLDRLEEIFQANQYPDTALQDETAHDMGVTTEKISIWFQNRRSKFKRESKSSHVMWMRKQIFEAGDGGVSPYGSPRLPELTGGLCHVLSPLEPASCPWWETQNASSLCGMPTFRDPTCSLLDLQSTPNSPTPTYQSCIDMPNNSAVFSDNSGIYDSFTNGKTCSISETPNTNLRKHAKIPKIRDQDGFIRTLHRPPLLPRTTSNHHVNRTSTPNSCRLACPTRLDFYSPRPFNEGSSDVPHHNNYSFYGNSSFHCDKTAPQLSNSYSQPSPAHSQLSDSCSKKHKYPLANRHPESQFLLADDGLPFGDKFPSVVDNYQLADDKVPTASDSSLFHLPWQ